MTYVPPTDDASPTAHYDYALFAVCHHEDIENERTILKRLQRAPHVNILEAISLEYPEGIYLRRYIPLSRRLKIEKPPQPVRVNWYKDMLRALVHLHGLEIAHSDVRPDNFLCDLEGAIVLCDFTCSRSFGQDNPSATSPGEALGVNGPSQTVTDITDRFALASVMFEIETGRKPDLTLVNRMPEFPAVKTDNEMLDSVTERAWLAKYESTMDMLRDIEAFCRPSRSEVGSDLHLTASETLQTQIDDWRYIRMRQYGNFLRWQRLISRLLTLLQRSSV